MMPGEMAAPPSDDPTLDQLFRLQARRCPQALALADPVNRASFTDGEARRLSYAEADRIVDAVAARLREMGLPVDSIVGIQLPNIAEHIIAMLGVWRAGMIVAPLPLLWRRADAVAALSRIGAKALITCSRVGTHNHCQIAMGVAADVFSVRYVCAFGQNPPDGVVPFDDLLRADKSEPSPEREPLERADARIAAVTFDVDSRGVVTVARNHAELIAGGTAVVRETGITEDSGILSTLAPSSFAGLCLTLVPWLLRGGTLALHHPFDPVVLIGQRRQEGCATLVLPGPLVSHVAATGAFAVDGPSNVLAAWRSPDQLATSSTWREPDADLIDVAICGEAALVAGRRGAGGKPRPLRSDDAVVEVRRTDAGTLAVRGAMAPHRMFPSGIDRSGLPYFAIGAEGWIDTGYACRIDSVSKAIVVTAPPAGIAAVGGIRFPLRDLQDVVGRIDGAATLAALPDPLIGQRLIGNAADRAIMQAALNAVGVNPLVVAAFRDRSARAWFADAG